MHEISALALLGEVDGCYVAYGAMVLAYFVALALLVDSIRSSAKCQCRQNEEIAQRLDRMAALLQERNDADPHVQAAREQIASELQSLATEALEVAVRRGSDTAREDARRRAAQEEKRRLKLLEKNRGGA